MKKLGVLGGMGPAASAEFMVRLTALTPASTDQEHIPTILWSDPRVPDRNTSIQNNDNLPLLWLHNGIRGLQAAGCEHIVIPCNTAHYWYDELVKLGTPITHIVDSVAEELYQINVKKETIGVLGTQATINWGVYQTKLSAHGWHCIIPSTIDMTTYVQPGIDLVKGNHLELAHSLFMIAINNLVLRGAKAIVLGCTEIPLAVREDHYQGVFLINSIDSLAKAAIKELTK
jgi:aspartate racemase